ncbi:MAG: hypothetical protein A2261_04175 [Candidatus Magasanikbacteria bacterium RIFOXYA2_FULL_44_8]|uniref:Restriction endonuclease n=1 Tax=Candidatus Magasanikbacteria bacterium RIFOXYA2_FULL_44_8 TaxID=1798696 RepID=A0A1F6NIU3_9BACT|nr:MAG: hypothetical protein A2261_04175 [Candidatus Magasanikbacteria bacterium RIFOXYA2_FULL_44_8]
MITKKIEDRLMKLLSKLPRAWDGRRSILEMKAAQYPHWKQMEWLGFYFQYLCETRLSPTVTVPGPKYGRVEFDGLSGIPWDFKAHPIKDASGKISNSVIVNDKRAILKAIKQYGAAGLILAVGEAKFNDEDRSFQVWHKELKGGLSDYEKKRILRKAPSRLRKVSFRMTEVALIIMDDKAIKKLGSFQKGFRNSDGSPRNAKVLLDLTKVKPVRVVKFGGN